jgi:hypothetical protein
MLINIGLLISWCTPGIWKQIVRWTLAKSFPIVFQIMLIFFQKKKIYCEFNVRAQKSCEPLFFKLKMKWQHKSKPVLSVLHFWENLQSGSDILKFMWWFRFEPGSSKIWTLQFQFYHIFSNWRTSGVQTQILNRVWFHAHITHSPMLKICEHKVVQQIRLEVYLDILLNN